MASAASTLSPSAPRSAAPDAGRPGLGLLVLLAATFMTSLDIFIVNVAIPAVQGDLGAGLRGDPVGGGRLRPGRGHRADHRGPPR